MKWGIISDSSCEYVGEHTNELTFAQVPFALNIDGQEYVDDGTMDISAMVDAMEQSAEVGHSSCPSPEAWYERFMKVERTIAIAISSNLSGSYNSALTARSMVLEQHPEKQIFVLDSRSAGSALSLFAMKAEELIHHGKHFEDICSTLQELVVSTHTVFALSSFGNLVKNGRWNRVVGTVAGKIAGKLGIWGIGGASPEGTIVTRGMARGPVKMIESIVNDMREHDFRCGHIIITHCQNSEMAQRLKARIREVWDAAQVTILPTGGLCSFYAERGGLIVAY